MVIGFANDRTEKAVNGADTIAIDRIIRRNKAPCTVDEIIMALDALCAAENLYELPKIPFRPHPLKGKNKGQFSVWINSRTRIIFRPDHADDNLFRIDNYKTIKRIVIVELCIDYHGH